LAATGDETATLTRQSRDGLRSNQRYRVWDAIVTATWDDDDTGDVTQAITVNGIIQKIVFVTPDATNAVTYQVQIQDNEDNEIFDSGELAEATTYTFSLHEPVTGTIDVVVGPSGALGATNPDATVTLRGI
jgi:hypothetical protein